MTYSKNQHTVTKFTNSRRICNIYDTGSCEDVRSKLKALRAELHYRQKGENLTTLITFQLLSSPAEHKNKICSQKSRQDLRYIFLHKKSRIIISLLQLTPNSPWELCNWMLLGLFWACKIEPVVLCTTTSALLVWCPTAFWIRGKNEISPSTTDTFFGNIKRVPYTSALYRQ